MWKRCVVYIILILLIIPNTISLNIQECVLQDNCIVSECGQETTSQSDYVLTIGMSQCCFYIASSSTKIDFNKEPIGFHFCFPTTNLCSIPPQKQSINPTKNTCVLLC